VPLVYVGKAYGKVRPHFRHYPGLGPPGGHHPETVWHHTAKQLIARWARSLPGVAEASVEHRTADGRRRSDVHIRLDNGTRLAIEVQQQPLTDRDWLARHHDYAAAGVIDVWLWHPNVGVPGIAVGQPQCDWQLSADLRQVGIPIAAGHARSPDGPEAVSGKPVEVEHHPPCPGDDLVFRWVPLRKLPLSPAGLGLPDDVDADLRHAANSWRSKPTILDPHLPTAARVLRQPADSPKFLPPSTGFGRHELHRVDACPPAADLCQRRFRCQHGCESLGPEALIDGLHVLVEESPSPMPTSCCGPRCQRIRNRLSDPDRTTAPADEAHGIREGRSTTRPAA
jgi:hypothetical protein